MAKSEEQYPVKFEIAYQANLNRVTTFFRIFLSIPILIVIGLLTGTGTGSSGDLHNSGKQFAVHGGSLATGLSIATALLILFRQRYPRWWFDFVLELERFSARVGAYVFLLTDKYPSTVDAQSVHLDIDYPDVKRDLNRWMPLFKWFLAIPHYIVLIVLVLLAVCATIIAWFAILFTGRYPKGLFDFVVGVGRWSVRVDAYAFLLTTDKYPPFSLK
jgi:hypothetical protein